MMVYCLWSAISGLLVGLSFNSSSLSFLAWFSLVPFIYVVRKSTLKEGIRSSIIFSFCYYGAAIFWLANVTKLGLIFLLIYLSFYYLLFFLGGRFFLSRPAVLITIPCLWVILEFLKENVWCGFGWANLGYSQYANIYLIQIVDLLGTKCISFLIVMVNVLIWEIWFRKKFLLKKIFFVFSILLVFFSYSFFRLCSLKEEEFLEVSVVQPNIPQFLKWDYSNIPLILDRLKLLGKETREEGLVVFPEASWPYPVDRENLDELETFAKNIKRDIILGLVIQEKGQFYNAALFFDKKGKLLNSYYKVKLVPFGEYVPLREFFSFISVINSIGDITAGREQTGFTYKGKSFSTLICFEDVFPKQVLHFSRKNDFLINITNDAWFNGEPQSSQHLGIMVFRALENRISIVRSANTGISGWVSFRGEIEKLAINSKDVFFPGIKSFNISLSRKRSFYNKYPYVLIILCGIFLIGVLLKPKYKL